MIEQLPAFQTGYVYHMEFGTSPLSIYQFRPFKKIEPPPFELDIEEMDCYNLCFGITPAEGIELTVVRSLSASDEREHIEFCKNNLTTLPVDERMTELARHWNLPNSETQYIREIAEMDQSSGGYADCEAFDRAKIQLSKLYGENVLLFHRSAHSNFGRPIDMVCPNAKVWVPEGGLQFLTHDWFRAIQHYPVSLLSYKNLNRITGDKVRVHSNGIHSIVTSLNHNLT